MLILHKLYKQNTQTGYPMPWSKGKSWLSGSHRYRTEVTTGNMSLYAWSFGCPH